MDLGLRGRVALVTGSTRGLGRAVATLLADEGARVAVNGRHPATVDATAEAIARRAGHAVLALPGDVSAADQASGLVARTVRELGRLDILICNAGGPRAAPFDSQPPDAWQGALNTNLLSAVHLTRAAVPVMRRSRWGRIVCLASVAAKQPLPGLIVSTTVRAGVLGFAKALADEVAAEGITVNVVCPGYIATERMEELVTERATRQQRSADEVRRDMVTDIPEGRIGQPDELAAAVVFLASERASYITGAALQVDGGFVRSIF